MTQGSGLVAWQARLRPVMTLLLVGLAVFFFVASMRQLSGLQDRVAHAPAASLDADLQRLCASPAAGTGGGATPQALWAVLVRLEENALARRYHLAQATLMARLWARYLGFTTGMILALVGASFVLGKLREASSTVNMDASFGKVSVISTSPGILLAVLGTTLMLATVLTNPEIRVNDAPVYLGNFRIEASPGFEGAPAPADTSTPEDLIRALRQGGEETKP